MSPTVTSYKFLYSTSSTMILTFTSYNFLQYTVVPKVTSYTLILYLHLFANYMLLFLNFSTYIYYL